MVKRGISRLWNLGKETNGKAQGVVNTYSFLAELFHYIFTCSDWYLCWCVISGVGSRGRGRGAGMSRFSQGIGWVFTLLSFKPITHSSSEKYLSAHSKKHSWSLFLFALHWASRWAVGRLTLLTTPSLCWGRGGWKWDYWRSRWVLFIDPEPDFFNRAEFASLILLT